VWYWLVTGEKPVEAAARVHHDPQTPASQLASGRYSAGFLGLIDHLLEPDEDKRPQDALAVLQALKRLDPAVSMPRMAGTLPDSGELRRRAQGLPTTQVAAPPNPPAPRRRWLLGAAVGVTVVAVAAGVWRQRAASRPLQWALVPGALRDADRLQAKTLLAPATSFLEKAIGGSINVVLVDDFGNTPDGKPPEYDVLTAPLNHLAPMVRSHGFVVIAKGRDVAAEFLVRADSPMQSLNDLKGSKIGVLNRSSAIGPISVHALAEKGHAIPSGFAKFVEVAYQDDALAQLANNQLDVVAVSEGAAGSSLPAKALRSIGKSQAFPGMGIAIAERAPEEAKARFTAALWAMQSSPEGKAALAALERMGVTVQGGIEPTSSREFLTRNEVLAAARALYPPPAPTAFGNIAR
jgi:hypothetical protein